jgi:hypothetical protein
MIRILTLTTNAFCITHVMPMGGIRVIARGVCTLDVDPRAFDRNIYGA